MPDLSRKGSLQFWKDYQDPMIYRVIAFMEGVEEWALADDKELEASMEKLGNELEDVSNIELGREDQLIRIAAYIHSSRTLRLLQAIDTAHPGSASKLLIHAEEVSQHEDDPAGIFLRRNIVFERLRLLGRVFSAERISLALKALEEDDHE
ncbi:MAG: type IVB secretion system protein IcmW [Legionellales bacterium]|nr:type IVB secretion system protein IcmW [Legionellales bacterium]